MWARCTDIGKRFAYFPARHLCMNWQADSTKSRAAIFRRLVADPASVSLRMAVLAAHPDDETIGASALLARFPTAFIVYLTDGAPRDKHLWQATMQGSREDYTAP